MKRTTFTALALVLAMIFSGCSGLPSGNTSSDKKRVKDTEEEVSEEIETSVSEEMQEVLGQDPEQESAQTQHTETYQSTLLNKIPLAATALLGSEDRDVVVNGHQVRLQAIYEFDPADFESDKGFTYYRVQLLAEGVLSSTVDVGRVFFDEEWTRFVREEANGEEEALTDIFWRDFRAAAFKGKDKEYIVFSVPAGWEENSSTMAITTDDGILLANLTTDKSSKVTLTGDDVDKYKDEAGNCNFFNLSGDAITYLKVSEVVDGVTYLKEYSVSIENNKVTVSETGKTYQTNDKVPELKDIAVY